MIRSRARGRGRWYARWASIAGAALAALSAGCAPTVVASAGLSAIQAGTTAFVNGTLEAAVETPMLEVFDAAFDTLVDLGFDVTWASATNHGSTIVARDIERRRVNIGLQKSTSRVTRITIRVGLLGDHIVSRLILARVVSELRTSGFTPLGPIPPTPIEIAEETPEPAGPPATVREGHAPGDGARPPGDDGDDEGDGDPPGAAR